MPRDYFRSHKPGWRWAAAVAIFFCGLIGLQSGVTLSALPELAKTSLLAKAYYSFGLFVFGGLDIGVPTGGPLPARILLWLAYFGAPLLTASAVIDAAMRLMSPRRWQLKRLKDHVVVVGSGELSISYLRVLRRHSPEIPVVVVVETIDTVRELELKRTFDVTVVNGDITHEFVLQSLRLDRASRVLLLGDDNFDSFEAASKMLSLFPGLGQRIVLHCHQLRFLRAMQDTHVVQQCVTFNAYHLAATGLVRDHLMLHFRQTAARDRVVIAGFGRFGQTVLEELSHLAAGEVETVAIIDVDANRRMLVAEEQQRLGTSFKRAVFQGDIAHPDVWRQLSGVIDLALGAPVVIMGTGRTDENLRTALWLKKKYPNVLIFVRCNQYSDFASRVGTEQGIHSISVTTLLEDNIPQAWVNI